MLREVSDRFGLARIVLLFDEAAHTFIPAQQEIFFELFKYLQGGQISCKAAVYPTVTSYGRNFEVGHDALVLSMDRYEPAGHAKKLYRQQFREIVQKRLPPNSRKRKEIFAHGELLDLCVDISTGNPRAGQCQVLPVIQAVSWPAAVLTTPWPSRSISPSRASCAHSF